MSKQKSKQPERQRFSGPELSELLDRVVTEHGSTAAISAVNRIRSGGIAGFFCKEEFEIIVDGPEHPAPAAAPTAQAPEPASVASGPAPPGPAAVPAGLATEPAAAPAEARITSPAERAAPPPAASAAVPRPPQWPVGARTDAVDRGGSREVFGGPRPQASHVTDAGFLALLERRLDETSATESDLAQRRQRRTRSAGPALARPAETESRPIVPAPSIAPLAVAPLAGTVNLLAVGRPGSAGFWLELQRAQHELASFMPLASPSVAVIGPLALTTATVRRLRGGAGFGSAEVIALTDRAEIVSEPSWQLVRSGHQLVEVAQERRDWPTILLVDVPVELPNWVAPLQHRLRMAGVGLFRYAVPGTPSAERLDAYRLACDVPYALDLVSRVEPQRLVDIIAQRHPVASVAGTDLNAELLVALRRQVGAGRTDR